MRETCTDETQIQTCMAKMVSFPSTNRLVLSSSIIITKERTPIIKNVNKLENQKIFLKNAFHSSESKNVDIEACRMYLPVIILSGYIEVSCLG